MLSLYALLYAIERPLWNAKKEGREGREKGWSYMPEF